LRNLITWAKKSMVGQLRRRIFPLNNGVRNCRAFAKSISSGTQYGRLQNYFSHPSSVIYSFFLQPCNPTHRTETGTANGGRGLLTANHLDQSLWWTNQKYWAAVKSYILTSGYLWPSHTMWRGGDRWRGPFLGKGNQGNKGDPKF